MPKPSPFLLETARYPAAFTIAPRQQDVDPNRHVNNVAVAALIEDAVAQFHRADPLAAVLPAEAADAASQRIEYLAETFYPAPVKVSVGVLHIADAGWTIAAIAEQGGRATAFARYFMHLREGEGAVPAALRDVLGRCRIDLGERWTGDPDIGAPLDPAVYPQAFEATTRFQDIDSRHRIKWTALGGIIEDARVRFDVVSGIREALNAAGLKGMVVSLQARRLGWARYPDPLVTRVGLVRTGRSSWTVATLNSQGDQPVCIAESVVVATREGRSALLPEDFSATLAEQTLREAGAAARDGASGR